LTHSSTTLSFGLKDGGNGTGDKNPGAVNNGDIENNEQTNGIVLHASETEEEELLQTLQKMQAMGRELRQGKNKKRRPSRTESDEQHDVRRGCSEHDVSRLRKRKEAAAHSLPCGSCGAVPDPTQDVLLPIKLGGNTHEITATERKTATLLKPLTMDRQEDGSFDPRTYCEYWLYKDAVCPATDTIRLCTACRVSLGRRHFHKFRKRNGFDMFDNYPEELGILNSLETALVSIIIPTNRMFRRHHYQQTHSIGQTLTFWNSTQTVATSLPRGTNDSSILILTDEHGKSVLDHTPLRGHAIFAALKYLKENNEQYSSVTIDSVAIDNLQRSPCPFVTERGPEPQLRNMPLTAHCTQIATFRGPRRTLPNIISVPQGIQCPNLRVYTGTANTRICSRLYPERTIQEETRVLPAGLKTLTPRMSLLRVTTKELH